MAPGDGAAVALDVDLSHVGTWTLPEMVTSAMWARPGELMLVGTSGRRWSLNASEPDKVTGHRRRLPGGWLEPLTLSTVANYTADTVTLWHTKGWEETARRVVDGRILDVRRSPDGRRLAVATELGQVLLLQGDDLSVVATAAVQDVTKLAWRESSELVAGGAWGSVVLLSLTSNGLVTSGQRAPAHEGGGIAEIRAMRGGGFATLGEDRTVQIWNSEGHLAEVLESTTGERLTGLDVSSDGRYAVILSEGGNLTVHDIGLGQSVLDLGLSTRFFTSLELLGFEPDTYTFACQDSASETLSLYSLVPGDNTQAGPPRTVRYRNAKIVLVGDSGVGKSGLALALTGKPFIATESTHARTVWSLGAEDVPESEHAVETHELLLWDLAGQPGYRSFHKLSLRDVAVGLLVFDARSESDPFRGVPYWARSLDEAAGEIKPVKILVSARSDRGGVRASIDRVRAVVQRYGLDRFIETSAKRNHNIDELRHLVRESIPWRDVPVIVAPEAFLATRRFLVRCKENGVLLSTAEALHARFVAEYDDDAVSPTLFVSCLKRLEAAGLVAALSLRDEWLLQPELLDSYVAAMAQAARAEPDGLGQILEADALAGNYPHDVQGDAEPEKIMWLTAVQEVVERGLALRVPTDRGQMLVFPAERRTDLTSHPGSFDDAMEYRFAGSVAGIYATVAVKLINSLPHGDRDYRLFHNAALFGVRPEEIAGFAVDYPESDDESSGRAVVFFGPETTYESKISFLRYVDYQLGQLAGAGSFVRQRIYSCCGIALSADIVAKRRERGHATVLCPVCGRQWPLDDLEERASLLDASVLNRDHLASQEQAMQGRMALLAEREAVGAPHAFVCYSATDTGNVRDLVRDLRGRGVLAWYDEGAILGGDLQTREIEGVLKSVPAIIVAVGADSMGRWQEEEYYASLSQVVTAKSQGRNVRLIPVLLPGAHGVDDLPPFLRSRSVVDMRASSADRVRAVERLVSALLPHG